MSDIAQSSLFTPVLTVLSLLAIAYLQSLVRWRARTRGLPLPPGPKPLPIISNLFNMPGEPHPWVKHRDVCAEYGDIVHYSVFGQSIVVLGGADVIFEYLDKRSAITSDRKQTPMIKLSGSSLNLGLMPYGLEWRRHRRAFWQYFHRDASVQYQPVQRAAAHKFLEKLLDDPSQLKRLIRFAFTVAVLKVLYNIDVLEPDDRYVTIAEQALEGPVNGLTPGRFTGVEMFPWLQHIPSWFPGATSQRLFKRWMAAEDRLKNVPFNHVKASAAHDPDSLSQSIIGRLLARLGNYEDVSSDEEIEIVKNVGGVAFEGGVDTVYSTLQSMFVGVSLHPEVLRKAQAELDTVVGPHRLPDFSDRDSLVYVNAIIKESMRRHTVLPLGAPHCTTMDDEFRGYFIPAGTVLIPNTWACMNDPEAYVDPEAFRPERFVGDDGQLNLNIRDPAMFAFGFGRRMCPGRHFAEAGLFITVASLLHVFDITPPLDERGRPIEIEQGQTEGFLSYPVDCRCTIKPRSAEAEALIRFYAAGEAEA